MGKRITAIFFIILFSFTCLIGKIYHLAINDGVSAYTPFIGKRDITVSIYRSRGMIYDVNANPLTEEADGIRAVVDPRLLNEENIENIKKNAVHISDSRLTKLIKEKRPFAVDVKNRFDAQGGIEFFDIKYRYESPYIAQSVIGYLDSSGKGVGGIEKWYDKYLLQSSSELKGVFFSDAGRRAVSGLGMTLEGEYKENKSGVVLTIDKRIQLIVQQSAEKYLESGAILVSDISTGEIKAIASYPDFNPYDISRAVSDDSGALLNRALMPFNAGSSFKIVITAAALEMGINEGFTYNCTGHFDAGSNKISCYNKRAHGRLNMTEAFAQSCNTYFINLAMECGAERVLDMAMRLGFGSAVRLCDGIVSQAGLLPTKKNLSAKAALANFSIGQGELLVTPVQMLQLSAIIANGGRYRQPSLVKGFADSDGNLIKSKTDTVQQQIISEDIAGRIKSLMITAVERGTGKLGKPMLAGAGAKTASAETGIIKDGRQILQTWITGFFPASMPKYAICVLYEDGHTGGQSAAPIFKDIADNLIMQGIY